jgi:tetratricopeptide (TPR) repeat protein
MDQKLLMYNENAVKNNYIVNKILSKIVSDKIDKMLVQAFENVEDENYSDALKLYDLALREEPDNPGVLIDKGATLQNMGKLKLAIRSYNKALDISPDNLDALLNKGAALHSDQKYSEAIECYDVALKVDKKCAMALAYKGLSLGAMGELHDAIKHFKKALSIDKYFDLASISKDIAQELLKSIKENKSKIQ